MIDGFSKPKLSKSRKFQNLIMTPVSFHHNYRTTRNNLEIVATFFSRNSILPQLRFEFSWSRNSSSIFTAKMYIFVSYCKFISWKSFEYGKKKKRKERTKFSFQCLLCDLHGTMRSMYSGRNFRTLILSLSIFLHTHTHKIFVFSAIGSKELPLFQLLLTRIDFIFPSFFFFFFWLFICRNCEVSGSWIGARALNDHAIVSTLLKNISP